MHDKGSVQLVGHEQRELVQIGDLEKVLQLLRDWDIAAGICSEQVHVLGPDIRHRVVNCGKEKKDELCAQVGNGLFQLVVVLNEHLLSYDGKTCLLESREYQVVLC